MVECLSNMYESWVQAPVQRVRNRLVILRQGHELLDMNEGIY